MPPTPLLVALSSTITINKLLVEPSVNAAHSTDHHTRGRGVVAAEAEGAARVTSALSLLNSNTKVILMKRLWHLKCHQSRSGLPWE